MSIGCSSWASGLVEGAPGKHLGVGWLGLLLHHPSKQQRPTKHSLSHLTWAPPKRGLLSHGTIAAGSSTSCTSSLASWQQHHQDGPSSSLEVGDPQGHPFPTTAHLTAEEELLRGS